MEWCDDTIARLRALWDEGHSTAEIGRRLGVSKNAVVGKAHRLVLPARPSPIRRETTAAVVRPAAQRRVCVTGPTLPPLATSVPTIDTIPAKEQAPPPMVERAPQLLRPVPSAPRPPARRSACCWPIGEPGTKAFHFCDGDALSGKPYCAEHAKLAYVKVRDRREDAA